MSKEIFLSLLISYHILTIPNTTMIIEVTIYQRPLVDIRQRLPQATRSHYWSPRGKEDTYTNGPQGHRATGPQGHRATGPQGHRATRPQGQTVRGPEGQRP